MRAKLFLTDGFEEIEALAVADILRRGGVDTVLVSLTGKRMVTGSHGITVQADVLFDEASPDDADMLILPGGPGAAGYIHHQGLVEALRRQHAVGKYLAAICAAPVTLGKLGLLNDRTAICYPGMEGELNAAAIGEGPVVVDGPILTGKGPGSAFAFGLALLETLTDTATMERVKTAMTL